MGKISESDLAALDLELHDLWAVDDRIVRTVTALLEHYRETEDQLDEAAHQIDALEDEICRLEDEICRLEDEIEDLRDELGK